MILVNLVDLVTLVNMVILVNLANIVILAFLVMPVNLASLEILVYLQGVSKKRYFSDFCLVSVLEDGFYIFTCDLESEP